MDKIKDSIHSCDNCLWLSEIDPDNNHYACSNSVYFHLHLEKNTKGKWIRIINKKKYFVGNCLGHTRSTPKTQKALFKGVMTTLCSKEELGKKGITFIKGKKIPVK